MENKKKGLWQSPPKTQKVPGRELHQISVWPLSAHHNFDLHFKLHQMNSLRSNHVLPQPSQTHAHIQWLPCVTRQASACAVAKHHMCNLRSWYNIHTEIDYAAQLSKTCIFHWFSWPRRHILWHDCVGFMIIILCIKHFTSIVLGDSSCVATVVSAKGCHKRTKASTTVSFIDNTCNLSDINKVIAYKISPSSFLTLPSVSFLF